MEKKELLNAIKQGMLASEMAVKFKIHDLNLYEEINKLENSGYTLHRTYYSDGQFKYEFGADNKKNLTRDIDIITKPNEKVVRAVCMADLHLASVHENIEIVQKAYEHAIENDIHLVFMAGDILDGKTGDITFDVKDGEEQIAYFLKTVEYYRDILTCGVGGDHDESIFKEDYIDPLKAITNVRHNIVLPSYFNNRFNIKNSSIRLGHTNSRHRAYPVDSSETYQLYLKGHPHGFKFESFPSYSILTLPAASKNASHGISGFVELNLTYRDGCLKKIESNQYAVINGKKIFLGYSSNDINITKSNNDNIENYKHIIVPNPYSYISSVQNTEVRKLNGELEYTKSKLNNTFYKNKKLIEKNNTLEVENENLAVSLQDMTERNKELESIVNSYESSNAQETSKMEELEKENKRVFDSNRQLTTNNKILKDDNKNLRDDNKNLKENNQELLKELNEYKRLLEELQNKEKEELDNNALVEPVIRVSDEDLKSKKVYSDFVRGVMDQASLELCGEVEKKRILKNEKKFKKDEKTSKSQMSKQERIEELRKKMAKCKK